MKKLFALLLTIAIPLIPTFAWAITVPWNKTTSGQVYPPLTSDIVVIGAASTSTAEYWFDPNVGVSYLSGKVGIGSTSPVSKLSVVDTVNGGGVYVAGPNNVGLKIQATGTGGEMWNIHATDNGSGWGGDKLVFTEGGGFGAVRMTIVGGGDVGIGTTSPDKDLSVSASTNAALSIDSINASSNDNSAIYFRNSNNWATPASIISSYWNSTGGVGGMTFTAPRDLSNAGDERGFVFKSNSGQTVAFINTTNGNIGIGTTSPYDRLSVTGRVVAQNFLATSTTATSAFLGKVGVGTISPSVQFQVGTTTSQGVFQFDSNIGSASVFSGSGHPLYMYDTSGNIVARFVNTGALYLRPNSATDAVAILSSGSSYFNGGNVGIGTSSPSAKLSVIGNGTSAIMVGDAGFSNCSSIKLGDGSPMTTTNYHLTSCASDQSLFINTQTNRGVYFRNNNTDVMTLASSGNLGLATTSPYAKLSVVGEAVATNFFATSTNATSTFFGGVDTNSARVKTKIYPSFSFPSGINSATTTTATTTIAIGTAFVSQQYNTAECFTGSGTVGYRVTDGTNAMDYELATSTVSRFTLSTNNTFQVSEKRFIEIGPMTTSYLSCTFDVTQNY